MNGRIVQLEKINEFKKKLFLEEKSERTSDKYIRDCKSFCQFCGEKEIKRETVLNYKQMLIEKGYKLCTVNSYISSINSLFKHLGWDDFRLRQYRVQKSFYRPEEKELCLEEYKLLCRTAEKSNRENLSLIMQTIASTGIRIGELHFITVEAVIAGTADVCKKSKIRSIFIPETLKKKLMKYMDKMNISSGPVFLNSHGSPVKRSVIWNQMKHLCRKCNINPMKVYPHNLRHLFARQFYCLDKDIAKLADILGHSSINTTRLYIVSTGTEHRKLIEKMNMTL